MSADPLNALFHPLASGALAVPAGAKILFMNAQACEGLAALRRFSPLAQTYFRYHVLALERAGYRAALDVPEGEGFDLVLLHGARQHGENLYAMAAALSALKPGGTLVCAAANDAGGRRLRDDAAALGFACEEGSKSRSRIIWGRRPEILSAAVPGALRAGNYQPVLDGHFVSRPGVFGWDRIDEGSALLAECLPRGLAGRGADFGSGFGFLAASICAGPHDIKELWCLDADIRAVDSARRNLESLPFVHHRWVDMGDRGEDLPAGLDWIVMNPPFHEGKAVAIRTGQAFIERAASSLRRGGVLWMVANAHLPYEEVLGACFTNHGKIREARGYKIFRAEK